MLVQLLRIFVQKNKKQFTQHFNYLLYPGGKQNLKISLSIIWMDEVKFLEYNLYPYHLTRLHFTSFSHPGRPEFLMYF